MSEHTRAGGEATDTIFAWRGDEVVLFGERSGDRWVLARGWSFGDRLVDVRRWTFGSPQALAGQVRRLAREATGNHSIAAAAADAALNWALGVGR
jgi:hypothetical protein